MNELLETLAAALCHRKAELTPAGLLCFRCLGAYLGALGSLAYLLLRRRLGRDRPKNRARIVLALLALPLVADLALVNLTEWSPPGWWRTLTATLGAAALYTLLLGGLLRLRRRGAADRAGGHLEPGEPLVDTLEALALPGALAALTSVSVLIGGVGLRILDNLALAGTLVVAATVAALPWAHRLPPSRGGSRLLIALGLLGGAALWLLLVLLKGS
ncbi:MAG: DUF2085 domain-containing protein [Candidatus Coatesbacteria bacterium]|nr:DUF2085 domain-containing protein [Candidatus Coatesbacteria bacterium]